METPEQKKSTDLTPAEEAVEQPVVPVKKTSYLKWGIIGGVLFLVLWGGIYIAKKSTTPYQSFNKPPQKVQLSTVPNAQPTKPRSKAPGIIVHVVTSKGIDPKTGEATGATSTFLPADKSIYTVVSLKNARAGTKIEYVRYLNNKFLDNRSITITKPSTNNASFVWTLKKIGATHPRGTYRVKVYTNGIFEKETTYTVQ